MPLDTSLVKRKPAEVCDVDRIEAYPKREDRRGCWNRGRFWVEELGLRLCSYHLGDALGMDGKDRYTLERLEW